MGFIKTSTDSFKTAFKPKLDWKGGASNLTNSLSSNKTSVIAADVDDIEFKARYNNVRISALSSAIFMLISILTLLYAKGEKDYLLSSTSSTLFFMFYFRYSYMLWVCRNGWSGKQDIQSEIKVNVIDFVRELGSNPLQLLPLSLSRKGSEK